MQEAGASEDGLDRIDRLTANMIGAATLAGAYVETIRRMPETASGFGKLAAKHQARVAALADEIRVEVESLLGRPPAVAPPALAG